MAMTEKMNIVSMPVRFTNLLRNENMESSYSACSACSTGQLDVAVFSRVAVVCFLLSAFSLNSEVHAQQLPPRVREPGRPTQITPTQTEPSLNDQSRVLRPNRPTPPRLILGVYANPVAAGYQVAGVIARTPAAKAGLEPGDIILAVDGYQIGTVGELFFPMSQEIQDRASEDLRAVLLVRNVRNGQVLNLNVQFEGGRPFNEVTRDSIRGSSRARAGAPATRTEPNMRGDRAGSSELGADELGANDTRRGAGRRSNESPAPGDDIPASDVQGERTGEIQ